MEFLDNLRKQPEHIRKVVLWSAVIIIGIILIVFWFIISYQRIQKFPKDEFIGQTNMSALKEQIENFSK